MSKPQDRTVFRRPDGTWANKRNDASRASSVHGTQKEAQDAARQMLKNQGGESWRPRASTARSATRTRWLRATTRRRWRVDVHTRGEWLR